MYLATSANSIIPHAPLSPDFDPSDTQRAVRRGNAESQRSADAASPPQSLMMEQSDRRLYRHARKSGLFHNHRFPADEEHRLQDSIRGDLSKTQPFSALVSSVSHPDSPPLLSATSHIEVGDVVSGTIEAIRSASRITSPPDGWPRAADAGDSMHTSNPGRFILDGEIEFLPLFLLDQPFFSIGRFRPARKPRQSAASKCCRREFRCVIPRRAHLEWIRRQPSDGVRRIEPNSLRRLLPQMDGWRKCSNF